MYKRKCITTYSFNDGYLNIAPPEQIRDIMESPNSAWWIKLIYPVQFVLARRSDELGIEHKPIHPQTAEEVEALDEDIIRLYHQNISEKNHTPDAMKVFHRRFYDLLLPLPNGVETIEKSRKQKLPEPTIEIELPKTVKEVKALHPNQLAWMFLACDGKMKDLSFEVEAELNVRFQKTQKWAYSFTLSKLTPERMQNASEGVIRILNNQFKRSLTQWITLPQDVQEALNVRFKHTFGDGLKVTLSL